MKLVDRFLSYTKFDTQSAEDSQTVPSTPKQLIFAKYLKEELENEGLADVEMDEMGYIYATLKANTKKSIPTIGFISHYDTSTAAEPTSRHASSRTTTEATSCCLRVSCRRPRSFPSCWSTVARIS